MHPAAADWSGLCRRQGLVCLMTRWVARTWDKGELRHALRYAARKCKRGRHSPPARTIHHLAAASAIDGTAAIGGRARTYRSTRDWTCD